MAAKTVLVTGGSGFLGAALVKRLSASGQRVRVFDNFFRGLPERLKGLKNVELVQGDVRDPKSVLRAARGAFRIWHLAFVNGTRYFYEQPGLVLEVGVKGMVNVLDAALAAGTQELIVASSSEVYQTPLVVPTPEEVPLVIPNPWNPRYSYAAGKIITEMLALHGARGIKRVVLFRPHNVYGPDMGREHVIPQLSLKIKGLCAKEHGSVRLTVQGTGAETRSFVYIDDFTDGLMLLEKKGRHRSIYHIGTREEISIKRLAEAIGRCFGRKVIVVPGPAAEGGTRRRCPDTTKIEKLGYKPKVSLREGLLKTVRWYAAQK
jgi:nucleoside-diphosphate-sugar epimerase